MKSFHEDDPRDDPSIVSGKTMTYSADARRLDGPVTGSKS